MRIVTTININDFNPRSSYEERLAVLCLRRGKEIISIHAPHTRSDVNRLINCLMLIFQSTLLIRGATKNSRKNCWAKLISIHAPHTRSDKCLVTHLGYLEISIHAPHTRSDKREEVMLFLKFYFNPRSSYEERQNNVLGRLA